MKIGIDGRLWNETGVGRYIRNLVWELAELDTKNEYVFFAKKGFRIKDLGFKNDRWKIVETDVRWHSIAEQVKFPHILYKENLDLMHFTYFSLPIFYDKPFIVTIHDLIITHFPTGKASTLPYPLYHMKRIGYDFVMQHSITNSNKIIVPLNAVKEDVMQTFGISEDKIVVTKEGVSGSKYQVSSIKGKNTKYKIPDTKYFLYVGNAYPHKNLEFLIDAFVDFKKETKDDVHLLLVGKDDYFYQRLRDQVIRRKLSGIIFKHNLSDEELFALYSGAKAFVSPSLMEGFGLPPLEAMGSGIPVLLSDIPAFREVCQDSAWYFDPIDKLSLAKALRVVYDVDHKTHEQKIAKGLNRVKDFSWEKMAQQTLAVYESSISIR